MAKTKKKGKRYFNPKTGSVSNRSGQVEKLGFVVDLGKESTQNILEELYPHGHEQYIPLTMDELQLHSDKSIDYAQGGHPLGNFIRVAKILALYPRLDLSDPKVVVMVYAMKQLDAVLWGFSEGHVQKIEGLDSRMADIGVYAKIVRCMFSEGLKSQKPLPTLPK